MAAATTQPLDAALAVMSAKTPVSFERISREIAALRFPPLDWVVGIHRGGVYPAILIAHQLGLPLGTLALNYRDDDNHPRTSHPATADRA
jgi:hypoxanthine phosphoribosyltransferase